MRGHRRSCDRRDRSLTDSSRRYSNGADHSAPHHSPLAAPRQPSSFIWPQQRPRGHCRTAAPYQTRSPQPGYDTHTVHCAHQRSTCKGGARSNEMLTRRIRSGADRITSPINTNPNPSLTVPLHHWLCPSRRRQIEGLPVENDFPQPSVPAVRNRGGRWDAGQGRLSRRHMRAEGISSAHADSRGTTGGAGE